MRTEAELLVDCLQRPNRLSFPYMLTGSIASNYWGIPRSTHDIDFVLMLQPTDVPAFVAEFQSGFFLQPESVHRALSPPFQFNVLDEDSALKVDFWLLHGTEFEFRTFDRRISVRYFHTRCGNRRASGGGRRVEALPKVRAGVNETNIDPNGGLRPPRTRGGRNAVGVEKRESPAPTEGSPPTAANPRLEGESPLG